MKARIYGIAALAAGILAVLAPGALAAGGSVIPTLEATSPVDCGGTTTVTLSIEGEEPAPTEAPLDLVLVWDESGSINPTSFAQMRAAAHDFVNAYGVSATRQIGIVMFATTARVVLGLNGSATTAHNAINSIVQATGSTAIGDGLNLAGTLLSGPASQPGAHQVILLMTDGVSTAGLGANAQTVAALQRAAGVEIFAIGFGGFSLAELNGIATDPNSEHVFTSATAGGLSAIVSAIATSVTSPAGIGLAYSMTPGAGFSLVGTPTATAGTITPTATGFDWTLAELRTETVDITYTLQHDGVDGGTRPIHSSALLSWFDDPASQAAIQTFNDRTVEVTCNEPPVADAGADQTVALSAALVGVTLDGTGSTDDGDIAPLTYSWSEGATPVATGASPTVILGAGVHTLTLTVDDGEFTDTDEVVITVEVDVAGLCAMTESFVTKPGVAHALCVKLEHGQLDAYRRQVRAQSGKSMTAEQAAILIALSEEL